jgi:hypothetical protein
MGDRPGKSGECSKSSFIEPNCRRIGPDSGLFQSATSLLPGDTIESIAGRSTSSRAKLLGEVELP